MWVRIEKIVTAVLHEAHERQVGERAFLRTTWSTFRELAPSLTRHCKLGLGHRYRRSEIPERMSER